MNRITEDEQRYRRFRQQLLMEKKHQSCFISGSCLELPLGYVLSNPTDVDKMYWAKDMTASHVMSCREPHDGNRRFSSPTFAIDTQDCHIGFARLRIVQSPSDDVYAFSYFRKPSTPSLQAGKGPAWPKLVAAKTNANVTRRLLRFFNQLFDDFGTLKLDYVYAVYCPSWPPEAAEWISRERKNGWPSKDVIDRIVGLGCHLVSKPHQTNPDDETQWRYSFSQAEVILIMSWTDVQKYVYHVIRLIKSEVVESCGGEEETVLCTYFFKTLMFWACEEKPSDFWTDENLETSVGELLCQMIEWLIEIWCPNYFIRRYNMLDHLMIEEVDLSNEISFLLSYKETMLSKLLTRTRRAYLEIPLSFGVPNKIMEFALLAINNSNTHDALHSSLGTLHSILSASDNFVPELRHLFDAIQAQLRLTKVTGSTSTLRQNEISYIAKRFDSAKKRSDESVLIVKVFLRSSLNDLVDELAPFAQTHYGLSSLNTRSAAMQHGCETRQFDLTYISSTTEPSNSSNLHHSSNPLDTDRRSNTCNIRENIGDYRQTTNDSCSVTAEESPLGVVITNLLRNLSRNWKSPAHLVSAAYCANFYYAVLRDYSSAAEQCSMVFKHIKDLESNSPLVVNDTVFTNPLSVLLTNEWSALFDSNLQLVLGFITLSRDVLAKSQSSIHCRDNTDIRVCPFEFLKYINFQSVRKLNRNEPLYYECNFGNAPVNLFSGQREYRHVSRIVFITAIRASGIIPERISEVQHAVHWP